MKEFEEMSVVEDVRDILPDVKEKETITKNEMENLMETKASYQKNMMDEAWHAISAEAYVQMMDEIKMGRREAPIKGSKEEYYNNNPDLFDEVDKQKIKMDILGKDTWSYLSDYSNDAMEQSAAEHFSGKDIWKINNNLMQIGMIKAKICLMIGKEYEEWMLRLPANETHKEEKAMYLATNGTSAALFMDRAFQNYYRNVIDQYSAHGPHLISDPQVLKNLTVRQYFDVCLVGKDKKEAFLQSMKEINPEFTPDSKLFDVLKQDKMNANPDEIPSDRSVLAAIKEQMKDSFMTNAVILGRDFVKSNLSEQDQKLLDIGVSAGDFSGKVPKAIRDWVNTDAKQYIRISKVRKYNEAYDALQSDFRAKKAYGLDQKAAAATAQFAKKGQKPSAYDAFIAEHMGQNAFGDHPQDRKTRLALVITALIFKAKGMPFNKGAIWEYSAKIEERPAFQSLPAAQVIRGLYNTSNAIKIHNAIYYNTFGVKEENFQAYTAKMKILSENMMSSAGRSPEYQKLCTAVRRVAGCRACDNNLLVANALLIDAIEAYTKDKMKVRRGTDGNARFENALDALALVNTFVPGSRYVVRRLVDSIRKARKVAPGHRHYVDIRNYGAENARTKNVARIAEKQQQRGRMVG